MTMFQLTAHRPLISAPNSPGVLGIAVRRLLARVAEAVRGARGSGRVAVCLGELHPRLQRDLNIHVERQPDYLFLDRDSPVGRL